MSLIALELPTRDKAAADAGGGAGPERPPAEWSFAHAADGLRLGQQGMAALALLPRASRVVLVVPPQELAWHRIRCPKASGPKLRAALGGVLEDALLADDAAVHLALWGEAVAGREVWVAALDRAWLARVLGWLQAAGLHVDALVPAIAPGAPARGHVLAGADGDALAALADDHGVRCLPVAGSLARGLVQARLTGQPPGAASAVAAGAVESGAVLAEATAPQAIAWTTRPAAAAAAERWLGHPVPLLSDGEHLLAAALEPRGNLLQFEFEPSQRGLRVLQQAVADWRAPRWRWLRWGLVGTLLVNLAGLNAAAWQQRQAIVAREQAQLELLKASFPGVRSVLNAPLQMRAEAERARIGSGALGPGDFESLLGALSAAWPEGAAPLASLAYEPGRLLVPAGSLPEAGLPALRERLLAGGVQLLPAEGGGWLLRPVPGVLEAAR
jgi:general secretion pathway protein L